VTHVSPVRWWRTWYAVL
jgi:Phosphomannomutase